MLLTLLLLLIGCNENVPDIPKGKYEMEFPFLYIFFASSQARVDYVEKGTEVEIYEDVFMIKQNSTGKIIEISNPIYKSEKLDADTIESLRKESFSYKGATDISDYKNKYYYTVYEGKDTAVQMFPYTPGDKNPPIISFYVMDDELWIAPYWGDPSNENTQYHRIDFIARLKPKTD